MMRSGITRSCTIVNTEEPGQGSKRSLTGRIREEWYCTVMGIIEITEILLE